MDSVSSSAGTTPGSGEQPASERDSTLGWLRSALARYRRFLPTFSRGDGPDASALTRAHPPDTIRSDNHPQFPDRAYPLTYPGRDCSDINPTDAVGIETADGLRLSVPENPDATIVSDRWDPIER